MNAAGQIGTPAFGEPEAILVRTPNWLGDLLMSTAFLRALLARFPQARVDLITRRGFELLPLPRRGEIFPYDKALWGPGRFGASLRGRGHTHFFVLPPSFSSAWMAFRSAIPHRIGYRGAGRGWLLRPALAHGGPHRSVHLVREYLGLLAPWGAEPAALEAEAMATRGLDLSEDWIADNLPGALAGEAGYVVLAPGAEFGPAKQWPLAHYRSLAVGLAAGAGHSGRRIVVTGLPKDRAAGGEMIEGLAGGLNLCGETDLSQLVALLARAGLLVSNDSGAMHIGAALQIPQVALFGSSNPTWTAPLNPKAAVMYRGLECSPCYRRECPLGHTNCLREIEPEEVLASSLALLQ